MSKTLAERFAEAAVKTPVILATQIERDANHLADNHCWAQAAKRYSDAQAAYTSLVDMNQQGAHAHAANSLWWGKAFEMGVLAREAAGGACDPGESSSSSSEASLPTIEDFAPPAGQNTEFEIVLRLLTREKNVAGGAAVPVIPILHNPGKIILQFDGWALHLIDLGWSFEDITGG